MNDTGGKHLHDQWVASVQNGTITTITDNFDAPATNAFIFRMKAVKDYEFGNYVRNLRRAGRGARTATFFKAPEQLKQQWPFTRREEGAALAPGFQHILDTQPATKETTAKRSK